MATRYLSVKEAAAILGISDRSVYKLIKAGDMPGHFRLGTMHFIDEEVFRSGLKQKATSTHKTSSKHSHRPVDDRHGLLS